MASYEKRGDKHRIRWVDPSGVHRSKTFARRVDADQFQIKVSHELLSGSYVIPSRITVRAWGEQWRETKLHQPSSRAQVESRFRVHLYPAIGDLPLGKVQPSTIQAMVNDLSTRLSPRTVRSVYAHTASMFSDAVRDRLIVASPCVGIDLPAIQPRRLHLLTVEEVRGAIEGIDTRFRAAVVTGAELNRPAIHEKLERGYLDATTLMEHLIKLGVPQRTAHEIIGKLVGVAMKRDVPLAKLELAEFQAAHPSLDQSVDQVLGVDQAILAFSSEGSTAPAQVAKQVAIWKERLGLEA